MKYLILAICLLLNELGYGQTKPLPVLDSLRLNDTITVPDSLSNEEYLWDDSIPTGLYAIAAPYGGLCKPSLAYVPKGISHLSLGCNYRTIGNRDGVVRVRTAVYQYFDSGTYRTCFVGIYPTPVYPFHQKNEKMSSKPPFKVTYYVKPPEVVVNAEIDVIKVVFPPLQKLIASAYDRFIRKNA